MIENIIETLSKTYDTNLSNEERQKFFLVLDNYQNELFQLDHLKIFLSPLINVEAQIFGLKCLENLILYKWNTVDKNTAKAYLIEIIKEYNNFNRDENSERVVRWIISKCVMYFIRHECPQNCSTLIIDLINIQSNGSIQALILSIFYCISEVLPIDSHMSEKRKKEVIGYITENFDNIITFCLKIVQPGDGKSNKMNLQIESVQTIQSFVSWIKIENINSSADKIFSILITFLNINSSDYFILEVIETIITRKSRNDDRYLTLLLLIKNTNNWHQLLMNIKTGLSLEINPYSDEKFRYLQKLIDLLLLIGNTMATNFDKLCSNVGVNCFEQILELIERATHHPVKVLAVEMLSFWYNGFKLEDENLRKMLISKAQSLLGLLKYYSVKQSVRNPSNVDHGYLVQLFEPEDEENYINGIRLETSKAISTLTEFFSQDIVSLCLDMVYSIMKNIHQIPGNIKDQQFSSPNSEFMKELEASRFFTRSVMHNIFRPYSKTLRDQVQIIFSTFHKDIIDKGCDIITKILSSDEEYVHLVTMYLDLLCLLIPFAANNFDLIKSTLEKIFIWFNRAECVGTDHRDYGSWKQVNKNCGVWILRIFRDYHFIVTPLLFESIFMYYQSISLQLYEHPIIVEAFTIYVCQNNDNYSIAQKKSIMCLFIDHIKQVLMSDDCNSWFHDGVSIISHLNMDKPVPSHFNNLPYPSGNHQKFRNNLIKAVNCLYGICSRMSSSETDCAMNGKTMEILSPPNIFNEHIIPLLQVLLKILRALNQIWNSKLIHIDFSSFKDISTFYRDTVLKKSTVEKLHPNNSQSFGNLYVNDCRNFVYRLQETIWLTLGKCCFNLRDDLYHLKEWQRSVTEDVFADLDSMPNFKLTPLIKSFVVPFITYCPGQFYGEVVYNTIVPFMNYLFENLDRQWTNMKSVENSEDLGFEIDLDDHGIDDDNENLCNEIIEEQELRNLSKSLCELFRLVMLHGAQISSDCGKSVKLGFLVEKLFETSEVSNYPSILVILNNICRAIIWKDSTCCAKLSQLISPLLIEIHSRGFLSLDIIIFVFQQSICALNIFASSNFVEIKISLLSVCVELYDDYISKNGDYMDKFFQLLNKSTEKSIESFRKQMSAKINLKKKREHMQILLQPYLAVPTNQLFSQEVYIKDLPPLMKPHWKKKVEFLDQDKEPLCLEDLFKC